MEVNINAFKSLDTVVDIFNSYVEKVANLDQKQIVNVTNNINSIADAIAGNRKASDDKGIIGNVQRIADSFSDLDIDIKNFGKTFLALGGAFGAAGAMFKKMDFKVLQEGAAEIAVFMKTISGMFEENTGLEMFQKDGKEIAEDFKKLPLIMGGIIQFSIVGLVALPMFKKMVKEMAEVNKFCTFKLSETNKNEDKKNHTSSESKVEYSSFIGSILQVVEAYKQVLDIMTGGGILKRIFKLKVFGNMIIDATKTYLVPMVAAMMEPFKVINKESKDITKILLAGGTTKDHTVSSTETTKYEGGDSFSAIINGYNSLIDSLWWIFLRLSVLPLKKTNSMIKSSALIMMEIVKVFKGVNEVEDFHHNATLFLKGFETYKLIINGILGIVFSKNAFLLSDKVISWIKKIIDNIKTTIENIVNTFDNIDYKKIYDANRNIKQFKKLLDGVNALALEILFLGLISAPTVLACALVALMVWSMNLLFDFIGDIDMKKLKDTSKNLLMVGAVLTLLGITAVGLILLAKVIEGASWSGVLLAVLALMGTLTLVIASTWLISIFVDQVDKTLMKGIGEVLLVLGMYVAATFLLVLIAEVGSKLTTDALLNILLIGGIILGITVVFGLIAYGLMAIGGPVVLLLTVATVLALLAVLPIAVLLLVGTIYIMKLIPDDYETIINNFGDAAAVLAKNFIYIAPGMIAAAVLAAPTVAASLEMLIAVSAICGIFRQVLSFNDEDITKAQAKVTTIMTGWTELMKTMVNTFKEAGLLGDGKKPGAANDNVRGGLLGLIGIGQKSSMEAMMESIESSVKPVEMVMDLFKRVADGDLSYLHEDRKDKQDIKVVLEKASGNIKLIMDEYAKMLNDICNNETLAEIASKGGTLWGKNDAEKIFAAIDASVSPITKVLELFTKISSGEWANTGLNSNTERRVGDVSVGFSPLTGLSVNAKITKSSPIFDNALNNVDFIMTKYAELINRIAGNETMQELGSGKGIMGFLGFGESKGESIFTMIEKSVSPITAIIDNMLKLQDKKKETILPIIDNMGTIVARYTGWVSTAFDEKYWKKTNLKAPEKASKSVNMIVESVNKLDVSKGNKFVEVMKSMKEMTAGFRDDVSDLVETIAEELIPALADLTKSLPKSDININTKQTTETITSSAAAKAEDTAQKKQQINIDALLEAINKLTNEVQSIKRSEFTVRQSESRPWVLK